MRWTQGSDQHDRQGGTLNLTPLIDMLFLLIIFFVVTSSFVEEEKDLEVLLPTSQQAEPLTMPRLPIVINIRRDGTIVLYQKRVTLTALEKELGKAYAQQKGRSVIVRGDGLLKLQRCVDIVDVIKKVGFTKYTLKTRD